MLFSLFITLAATLTFVFRALFLKIRFVLSLGKRKESIDSKNIPIVIFSDHKRYWNVFKPICDEFEKRGVSLVFCTASADDPALSAEYRFVRAEYLGEGNKPYARLNMLHADVLVATTPNLGVFQWKRSRFVKEYVHIPHSVDELAGYRMFSMDHYDAVLTTGRNQEGLIRALETMRPKTGRKELFCVGSPALDVLKQKWDGKKSLEPDSGGVTVLLAPSWGAGAILSRYGKRLLSALVKTGFRIVVRPHPQSVVSEQHVLKPLVEQFGTVEWNFDNDNFEAMCKSSILITDFSGIIFDYALVFDKPLLYAEATFDTIEYEADWLSETRWALRAVEKIGVRLCERDFDRISDVVVKAICDKNLSVARDEVRRECWGHVGKSAELAADWLIEKQRALSLGQESFEGGK